jgi:cytochrome c-type biogenesis protein CcmH/NrfG
VAKALAVGLGPRIRSALENALRLAPEHADAHLALASFHADIIDKVGALIGRMTHNASAEAALSLYQRAQQLNPQSPITLVEHARGLLMLEGRRQTPEALALQTQAAALEPVDAMERLYMAAATEEAA